ncbi:MAG: DUF5615 family PIN-like protein [Thermoplasmatota archaeon]
MPVKGLSLKRAKDENVMKICASEKRALVTFDRDFMSRLDEKYDHHEIILFTKLLPIRGMLRELQKILD